MRKKQGAVERRRRRSAAEAKQIVAEFGNSGLGQKEFCRSRGISSSTLHRYRKDQEQEGKVGRPTSRLVAVELTGGQGRERSSGGELAVVLNGGRKIEVGGGFDEATLERLVNILERV